MDWNQLEGLKRRVEDEFTLDMAAVERLQKRFRLTNGDTPESVKEQLEQDYGLDMAAIERLQRKFRSMNDEGSSRDYPPARDYSSTSALSMSAPSMSAPSMSAPSAPAMDTHASASSKYEAVPQPPDQLESSLRTMFNQFSGNSKR